MRPATRAVFALVGLLGCAPREVVREGDAGSSDAVDAGGDAAFALAPMRGDDWSVVEVTNARVKLRLPSGARLPAAGAGYDAQFAGTYFHVLMPSGYPVYFAERHGAASDVAVEKLAFKKRRGAKGDLLYEADDAIVATRHDEPPTGTYCETTACGKIDGRPICATSAGARIDGAVVKKLTETECLAVVTMVRSIEGL